MTRICFWEHPRDGVTNAKAGAKSQLNCCDGRRTRKRIRTVSRQGRGGPVAGEVGWYRAIGPSGRLDSEI